MSQPPATAGPRPPRPRRSKSSRYPAIGSGVPTSSGLAGPSTLPSALTRRASVSGVASGVQKAQRTSKTSQKLVVLPSAPQTKPLAAEAEDEATLGYETDTGPVRAYKSEAERMTKEERKKTGSKRLTAYCVSEGFKMKLLATFLKREHNVFPRAFDEAIYAVCTTVLLNNLKLILMN
jgi:uncharacterized Rmd1/YagE family protein